MSVETARQEAPAVAPSHEEFLAHQFEDRAQQDESYIVGMWTFLVTEVMFFGALFLAYMVYRYQNPEIFADAHTHLNVILGGINTVVLLTSSFFMALGVRAAQLRSRRGQMIWISATIALAFVFLIIKGFEYHHKWEEHLVPGPGFQYTVHGHVQSGQHVPEEPMRSSFGSTVLPQDRRGMSGTDPVAEREIANRAQMFFSLYFAMTGLHGIHVILGILVMGVLLAMIRKGHPAVQYYMPVEMTGLYWHFVDIVWIFLFPLFYLIPR